MIISVKVKPGSSKQGIHKISEKEYVVNLKKSAEEGKANLELLKILKKYFSKEVRIKSGLTSRNKLVGVLE